MSDANYRDPMDESGSNGVEDIKSVTSVETYSTIDSALASVSSIPDKTHPKVHQLHQHIEIADLPVIQELFASSPGDRMSRDQLRALFGKFGKYFQDDTFEELFLKMNTSRTDQVGWDEFITFLITLFHNKKGSAGELQQPMVGLPKSFKTNHEFPVIRLLFCPTVEEPECPKIEMGHYVSTSEDGTIKFWEIDWTLSRTVQAKRFIPKITKTLILDCTCLPNVRMICVSSVDHDIRFYDFGSSVFIVRFIVQNFPHHITCLSYYFSEDQTGVASKLLMGDDRGNVSIIAFSPVERGPFRLQLGQSCNIVSYRELVDGSFKAMRLTTFKSLHHQPVCRIEYFAQINSFISVASCAADTVVEMEKLAFEKSEQSQCPGLVIGYLGEPPSIRTFHADRGMSCFAYNHGRHPLLATGGPDMNVRLWSPARPGRPKAVLPYHQAGISFMFFQDDGKFLYSLDKLKEINVWDTGALKLLQNYSSFTLIFKEPSPVVPFYNDITRELMLVGDLKVAIVKCRPRIDLHTTDGFTHTGAVSVVLYNVLYRLVITCGYDSNILIWEPGTGVRRYFIKNAHTYEVYGISRNVEITTACCDPKNQQLLTGARDGTLKIWNFLDGICVRHLSIEPDCEVTLVYWITDRILATGRNGRITEFADHADEVDYGRGKEWRGFHQGQIVSAVVQMPRLVITGSDRGELILWDLKTGQPYRWHNVDDPTTLVEIKLHRTKEHTKVQESDDQDNKKVSFVPVPVFLRQEQSLSITAILLLDKRPNLVNVGTFLTALSSGMVLVWSHHTIGNYLGEFNAIHQTGDQVLVMATDKENKYLFTGSALGYIKTWLLCNAWNPDNDGLGKVVLPALRLQFPFLWKDLFDGRAKRKIRRQDTPMLLNSYKGHTKQIMDLTYIDSTELLISTSRDKSTRMWTLSGRYIGTLGSSVGWPKFQSSHRLSPDYPFRLPPDIHREGSFTTLKVLNGGTVQPLFERTVGKQVEGMLEGSGSSLKVLEEYKSLFTDPVQLHKPVSRPVLDTKYTFIPVYKHLYVAPMTGILPEGKTF